MAHRVRDWMSSPVVVMPHEMLVSLALTLMRRRGIHSLVVDSTKDEPTYGIVTTTDVRDKIVGLDRDPSNVTVAEIMTSPVVCARPDWTLREASLKMQELGFHHLPVQDDLGNLMGIFSATDIFVAVEEAGWEAGS